MNTAIEYVPYQMLWSQVKFIYENDMHDINNAIIQVKELKKYTVLRTLIDLKPEIHNETHWSRKWKMLQKLIHNRSELTEA